MNELSKKKFCYLATGVVDPSTGENTRPGIRGAGRGGAPARQELIEVLDLTYKVYYQETHL